MPNRVAGCILAAGFSKRMGRPKPLLPIEGDTFLVKVVKTLEEANIEEILVVISSVVIKEAHGDLDVKWIFNPEPEKGPLYSFQLCIKQLECVQGAFLVPVDHPLVKRGTYQGLLEYVGENKILVPTYRGKRGHPPFFPKRFFNDILNAPLDQGARYILHSHPEDILEVEVDDPGILLNINTPEDLKKLNL